MKRFEIHYQDIELMLTVTAGSNSGFSFIVFNVGGVDHRHFYH